MARGKASWGVLKRAAAGFFLVLQESFRQFGRHGGMETAATLTFYGFLSLIPLLLLVIFLLSQFVLSSAGAIDAIESLSSEMFPEYGRVLLDEIRTLSGQGIWSAVTALILFGSILPFAAATRSAFRKMLAPHRPPGFFRTRLMDLAGGLTLLGLFVLVVIGRLVYGTLSTRLLDGLSLRTDLVNLAASFFFAFAGLYFFYLVFTPGGVKARHVAGGALTAASLLFMLRPAFGAFLHFNPQYGFAFGSLKAVFLLLMWVYLSCAIILLGAEVISNVRRRDAVLLRAFLDASREPGRTSRWLVDRFLRVCGPGETVFREGEEGHEMFYVQAGAVRLLRGDLELRTMGPGEYFGEMSMLADAPRSATAVAAGDGAELVAIAREHFDRILKDDPRVTHSMLQELARRLQATDDRLQRDRPAGPVS